MSQNLVTVEGAPRPLTEVEDIQVSVVRPDDSVVERDGVAVSSNTLRVYFHEEDLTLPGTYVGQVSFQAESAVSIFGPAFTIDVPPS
jgi:hypothetical protein